MLIESGNFELSPVTLTLNIVIILLGVAFFLQISWRRRWQVKDGNLPPGSMGYYGVGESLHLLSNPGPYVEERRKTYGSIYKTHILGSPTIRAAGPEAVAKILATNRHVHTRWPKTVETLLGPNALTNKQGEDHKNTRKHVMCAFKREHLQNTIPRIQSIIENSLEEWCLQEKVLVYDSVASMTFHAAWEVMIGSRLSAEEVEPIAQNLHKFIAGLFNAPFNIPGFPFHKALQAKEFLRRTIDQTVVTDKNWDTSSVIGQLLEQESNSAQDQESDGENYQSRVCDAAIELMFAGQATLSSAVTSMTMCLFRHETAREQLVSELTEHGVMERNASISYNAIKELPYLNSVIKEVLRLYPPVPAIFRNAKETFTLQKYTVPEGWNVVAAVKETHDDVNLPDPKAFIPDRWLHPDFQPEEYTYIPFGAGSRICVGREYAKLFMKVYAICLVRMCDVKLLSESNEFVRLPTLKPKDNLPAKFWLRKEATLVGGE